MRSIKELLQLMLDNEHLFKTGLCVWAYDAYQVGFITVEEYKVLDDYIINNRPFNGWIRNRILSNVERYYYWESCNIKPRIKWLKKHIKKN